MFQYEITVTINLLVAFVLSGLIGWLRERQGKTAGLRTHILVCVGAALFTLVSLHLASAGAEPSRIAAGVVTGIGFIGAGCILHSRGSISGITTASSIWAVAAIGIASGAGFYIGAVVTTIISIITLEFLQRVEKKIIKTKGSGE